MYVEDEILMINFSGDKPIAYNKNFRLFICTDLENPQFPPETCAKMAVIDFSVTFKGLEDKFLLDALKMCEPNMQYKFSDLEFQIVEGKNKMEII
jgi:dynein heavy chain